MTARLEGKVALITEAATGMGAEHARLFIKEGAKSHLPTSTPQPASISATAGSWRNSRPVTGPQGETGSVI